MSTLYSAEELAEMKMSGADILLLYSSFPSGSRGVFSGGGGQKGVFPQIKQKKKTEDGHFSSLLFSNSNSLR